MQFGRDIVSFIEARAHIDADQVFASGYSNGGMMSYRLICQAGDVFKAAAPACGKYFGNVYRGFTCAPSHPRPVAGFHDTFDPVVNYAISLAAYQTYALSIASCPLTTWVAYANPLYFGMTCYERQPCARADGKGSIWCQTNGAGHTFPPNLLERSWKFFTTGSMYLPGEAVDANRSHFVPLDPSAGAQLPPPAEMVNKLGDKLQAAESLPRPSHAEDATPTMSFFPLKQCGGSATDIDTAGLFQLNISVTGAQGFSHTCATSYDSVRRPRTKHETFNSRPSPPRALG